MAVDTPSIELRQITAGPKQHIFGYYDKCCWNKSGRYILTHEIAFGDHMPGPDDTAAIGIIDLHNGNKLKIIAETKAWCWQQGAMLQWWNAEPENHILFNDRRDGQFVCIIKDIQSGKERVLPRPVGAVSHDGKYGYSLNFARLAVLRPGYGYEGVPDPFAKVPVPDNDGITRIDLNTGKQKLLFSVAQAVDVEHNPTMDGMPHWFNHILISTDNARTLFLHRWPKKEKGWFTRMFTVGADGSNPFLLNPGGMTSHCDWKDARFALSYAQRPDSDMGFILFEDRTRNISFVGKQTLAGLGDGHCNYSPDRRWILSDTYPRDSKRKLYLYNPEKDIRVDLGDYFSHPFDTPQRCDLHPRWNRDGTQVCFDSSHTGSRQVYVIDVSNIVGQGA